MLIAVKVSSKFSYATTRYIVTGKELIILLLMRGVTILAMSCVVIHIWPGVLIGVLNLIVTIPWPSAFLILHVQELYCN